LLSFFFKKSKNKEPFQIFNSLSVKSFGALLAFLVQIILTNNLGAEKFGIYILAITWMIVIGTFLSSFLHLPIIRIVSDYIIKKKYQFIRGFKQKLNIYICISSSLSIIAIYLFLYIFFKSNYLSYEYFNIFIYSPPIIILICFININKSFLFAVSRSAEGMFSELVLRPAIMIFLILVFIFSYELIYPNPKNIILMITISYFISMIFSFLILGIFYKNLYIKKKSKFEENSWIKISTPFIFVSIGDLMISRTDVLILGVFVNSKDIAIYFTSMLLVSIISMITNSIDGVLAPKFAEYFSKKNYKQTQLYFNKKIIIINLITIPISLIIIFFGSEILSIFGKDFSEGKSILIILVISQIFHSIIGPVGMLLGIYNQQYNLAKITIFCGLIYLTTLITLIPIYGAEGAAIARLITFMIFSTSQAYIVWKKIGIMTSILAPIINFTKK